LAVSVVRKDLNLSDSALRKWLKQFDAKQSGRATQSRPITPEQRRIRELEKENSSLKQDVAILKKASAWFARELA